MFLRLFAMFMIIGPFWLPTPMIPNRPARPSSFLAAPTGALSQQIRDRYIVAVAKGRDAQAIAKSAGVVPAHIYRRALNGFVATLTAGQLTALQRHPDVVLIEPDQLVAATGTQVIDSTTSPGLWGLDRIDQQMLPLDSSYSYGSSGTGVTAYLIDSGLQANHPDFGTRAQNVYDPTGGTGNDCHGHGTHLAGIVGGTTYGVAKHVNLRGVRVLDCDAIGTASNAIRGIDWVATNAVKPAVATIAFRPANLDSNNSVTLQLAIENLIASGVFVAVAAGNDNVDACALAPANVAAAFTVAASTRTDQRYAASNYGACIDSYAPGASITSAWIGSTTSTLSGTSQATAFVAGAAVIYKASSGDQTQAAVNAWLIANATPNVIQGNVGDTPNRLLYLAPPTDTTPPVTTASVSGSAGCATNTYSSGATVTLSANEPATIQYRINGGAWQIYSGPIALTGAGVKTIEFFATDAAGNVETTKTITVTISSFPQSAVLDNFNRPNGALGPSWAGATSTNNYLIASQRVDVRSDGSIYWNSGSPFGVNQEAFVTLNVVDTNVDKQGLLLKLQGTFPALDGAISVTYIPTRGGLHVETFQPSGFKTMYPAMGGTLQNGDRLGAQALANGQVLIYKNCTLVDTTTLNAIDQSFFNTRGGRIGLWFGEARDAFFDDFGGGNVAP
ncbi:MAG TPA: S8 family serine peptidase [Herpetosiphonaceae bacterium]